MKHSTSWWESHLLNDEIYGNIRLKTLDGGQYVPYNISSILVEPVDLDAFLKEDDKCLPLLIGTQFGFFPRLNSIPGFYLEPRIVALLSKSVLSGNVAGMSICLILGHTNPWKVIRNFPDKPDYYPSSIADEIDPERDFGCTMGSGERLVVK
ncbi:MAG: hypothetical protein HOC81_01385 [Candidatus Marinimicrobia bacterium]|jgi:hypothetical protein|nr:hypothetical protein [Candidatus Neomarinimicrobiota bacterium]MBT4992801.1 hypothetical protein [Candidatus Neomarinimicrobiota bacterium]MBT5467076.1 hypothetical protein [Candidatus Neomarinimicrobiota bacterium]